MRILSLLFASAIIALANPAPFGFELEKATYSELTAKYPVKQQGFNELSQGKAITVAKSHFELDGLQEDVVFTFDSNDKLIAVVMTLNKNKFDDILSSLSKYKLVRKDIPFVGNKYAKFKDGNCVIELNAPHMSFSMTLFYVTNDGYKKSENSIQQDEQSRKSKQNSML